MNKPLRWMVLLLLPLLIACSRSLIGAEGPATTVTAWSGTQQPAATATAWSGAEGPAATATTRSGTQGPGATNATHSGSVQVEILYMDHSPLRPTLDAVDKLLAGYGDRVSVKRYEAFSDEGIAFAKAKNLTGHVPLAILINGSDQFTVNGQTVRFYSFPKGQGPGMVPDGNWSLDDLKQALDQATSQ